MTPLVILDIHLQAIRSFLDRVATSVDDDYREVVRRANAGEFQDADDEDNAFFGPLTSEEICIRAVLSELNSLVESELQSLAVEPLACSQESTKSKRSRIVWDLKPDELHKLLESYYHLSIANLPGSGAVEEIRQKINAYKHRGGVKDPRKDLDWQVFPEKFELDREQAHIYIQAVRAFLQSIRLSLTKR